jgi:NADH:ubiquinone oxidoreductase subunit 4 (subunit M)
MVGAFQVNAWVALIIATLIMGLAPTYVLNFTQQSALTIISQFAGATP